MVATIVKNIVFPRHFLPRLFTFDEFTVAGMSAVNIGLLYPNPGINET